MRCRSCFLQGEKLKEGILILLTALLLAEALDLPYTRETLKADILGNIGIKSWKKPCSFLDSIQKRN